MADLVVLGFDSRREAEEVFELGASINDALIRHSTPDRVTEALEG